MSDLPDSEEKVWAGPQRPAVQFAWLVTHKIASREVAIGEIKAFGLPANHHIWGEGLADRNIGSHNLILKDNVWLHIGRHAHEDNSYIAVPSFELNGKVVRVSGILGGQDLKGHNEKELIHAGRKIAFADSFRIIFTHEPHLQMSDLRNLPNINIQKRIYDPGAIAPTAFHYHL